MGACISTHGKPRRRRHHLKNFHSKKRRRGSAHFVIPVTGTSLGSAAQKYQLGKNAKKDIAQGGSGNAFLIERPITHLAENGTSNGHSQLEHQENGNPVLGSPSPRGSRHEAFFDTDNNFHNDSDDEFMSSYGDFPASTGNSLSYPANNAAPNRPTLTTLQAEMSKTSKVDDWMAGTSEEVGSLHSPPPEDEPKSTPPFGMRNGIAALAGNAQYNLRTEDNPLYEASPRKSFPSTATEAKVIASRPKWERTVSDLLGRRPASDAASPARNPAHSVSPTTGDPAKSGDYKGVFDGLCLPRLRTAVSSSRSRPVSPMSFRKKSGMMRFSFKRRTSADPRDDNDSVSSKYYVERPLAGSQVSHCSADKPVDGCWSEVSSTHFKLRGRHYGKDKRKIIAPNFSAYVPIGADLLMSERKIDHIAQYVELPFQDFTSEFTDSLPTIFIVNIQLPLYPPAIFMGDTDGEGLSLVLYFKLSDELAKTAPPYYKDFLRKFVDDEAQKVKGFVGESVLPFRDRLKVVARCVNPEEVQLSAAEKKLIVTYNEKPVLSRPQHCFHKVDLVNFLWISTESKSSRLFVSALCTSFRGSLSRKVPGGKGMSSVRRMLLMNVSQCEQGANYLEVDLDVHRFSYIARKGFDTFRDRLKSCVLDIGLTIQGTRPDELPEQILAAVRLHKLDFGDYRVLQAGSSAPSIRSEDFNAIPSSPKTGE